MEKGEPAKKGDSVGRQDGTGKKRMGGGRGGLGGTAGTGLDDLCQMLSPPVVADKPPLSSWTLLPAGELALI